MKTIAPVPDWKSIVLGRQRWPKTLQVPQHDLLPARSCPLMGFSDLSGNWFMELHRVKSGEYRLKVCPQSDELHHGLCRHCVRISVEEAMVLLIRHEVNNGVVKDLESASRRGCKIGERALLDFTLREILDEQIARKLA